MDRQHDPGEGSGTAIADRSAARFGRGRRGAIALALALGLGSFAAAAPAMAADPKPDNPQGATVALASTTVAAGGEIDFSGDGWTAPDQSGSVVSVKIDDGAVRQDDGDDVWATVTADNDTGHFSGTITLPASVTGDGHWLRFLAGSGKAGDTARSVHSETFSVSAPAAPASVTLAATTLTPGASTTASGAGFPADATVTVKIKGASGAATQLTTVEADADGAFSGLAVPIPADVDPGDFTLYFLAAGGISVQSPITVVADSSGEGPYEIAKTIAGGDSNAYEIAVDSALDRVFVAQPTAQRILVIDTATSAVVDEYATPKAPYGLTIDTTTHRLYSSDTRDDTVTVLDAKTGEVLATVEDSGAKIHGIEADPRTGTVYLAEVSTTTIGVLDGKTNTIAAHVASGKTPVQIVPDSAHKSYWVASTGDNTVTEYDAATNKVLAQVSVAAGPQNLAYNPATRELAVDNFGASSVQFIDTDTAKVTATVPVEASPIGIALDPVRDVYFVTHLAKDAETGTSAVSVIDGAAKKVAQVLQTPGTALGVGVDADTHTAYVADRDSGAISVIVPAQTSGDQHSAGVTITATVPDTGGLAISVEKSTLALSTAQVSPELDALVSTGALPTVTVADLRSVNPGWTATGSVTDFSGPVGSVDGKYLGWKPKLLSQSDGQTVTAGPTVKAGDGLVGGSPLATAAAGAGFGTATVGADLSLTMPSSTLPGTYQATLTLTVI